MMQNTIEPGRSSLTLIKALTYLMFMMFAMTTDSVGIIIPEIIKTFGLSMTAAGTFQYATMGGIALAGFFLGSLADRLGRKPTIIIGLTAFGIVGRSLTVMGRNPVTFLALVAAVEDGRIKRGDLVLLEAMGGGFTWGAALLRW